MTPRSTRSLLSLLLTLGVSSVVMTCAVIPEEGADPAECSDGADNDGDGSYDCSDEGCAASTACSGAGWAPGMLEDAPSCDAGDEAFVRRVVPQLWGRHPLSIREVDLMTQVIEQSDRRTLVRAMMRSEQFSTRWMEVIKDMLHVNRVGDRSGIGCTSSDPYILGDPHEWLGRSSLAAFVRDNPPDGPQHPEPWNLNDLILSSIALDDLSPVFRAQLFAQLGSRLVNLDNPGAELAWRTAHATIFENSYLSRQMVCLQCHNAEFSATDSADPEQDLSWQVPGYVEKALYGASEGRPFQDLAAFFRVEGVLAMAFYPQGVYRPGLHWGHGDGFHPWGINARCGSFILPGEMEEDPEGWTGNFIEPSDEPSVWLLERLLRDGFDLLYEDGLVLNDHEVDGEPALAWMLSMSVVEHLWQEVTGRPLTAPHFLPRNRYQRDLLIYLTEAFVENGYSLQALVEAIVLHPYLNAGQPDRCEGLESPYYLAPIFDPWVAQHDVPEQRLNTPGDIALRWPPRVLMDSTISALEWPDFDRDVEGIWVNPALDPGHEHDETGAPVDENGDPLLEPSPINEDGFPLSPVYAFEIGIGMFLLDTSTGFRDNNLGEALTWEERLGSCSSPFTKGDDDDLDWIDRLVEQAPDDLPLGHLILALKDRLIAQPLFASETEAEFVERLVGSSLDEPASSVGDASASLRRVCAALLSSPDFQLAGAPGPDLVGITAPFVPAGSTASDLCGQLTEELFADGTASCDSAGRISL